MLQLTVEQTQNLKEFTETHYAQGSFFWNYLLKNREIKVNGVRVRKDVLLEKGDVVTYYLSKKQEAKSAFYTVYKDDNLLIVDKESGVNSEAVFSALSREGEYYFIHRLDRNTAGLMAFARNAKTELALKGAFKERAVTKIYHALCFGRFEKEKAVLTAYLKKDETKSLVRVYDEERKGAEKIVTEYRVIEGFDGFSKVEVTLHTGKTHQIRAHLAHVGCPIVGDMKYGLSEKNKEVKVARQCLVAKRLNFDQADCLAYLTQKTFISRFDVDIVKGS